MIPKTRFVTTLLFAAWVALGVPASVKAQAATTPAVTKKRALATEVQVLDCISGLAEVQQLSAEIKQLSKGKRYLSLLIDRKPTKDNPYYLMKVTEDDGTSYVTRHTFLVDAQTLAVKYQDPVNNTTLDLSAWRQRNAAQKK